MIRCTHIEHEEEVPAVYLVTGICEHSFVTCLDHLLVPRGMDCPDCNVAVAISKIEGIRDEEKV